MDNNKNSSSSNATSNTNDTFRICNKITPLKDEPLKISFTPSTNDIVFSEKNEPITLVKELSKGGEGVIYETNKNDFVAKIYFKEKNTAHKFQKIKLMTSKNIKYEGICFPSTLLYNKSREFVGYLMPKASGGELRKTLFIKKSFLKYFPKWTKRETIILCLNILDKIKFLHSKNVILGDINPANILIVSPKEIYFVDTDSYQIENFPCPVGTINFTALKFRVKNLANFYAQKNTKISLSQPYFL